MTNKSIRFQSIFDGQSLTFIFIAYLEGWLEGPVVPAPMFVTPKDLYNMNNGYTRKQRAQHGSKV